MAHEVARKRIQKFKQDLDFLVSKGFSQDAIAEKMGMAGTNFSTYYNENIPISNPFIAKFRDAWAAELEPEEDENLARELVPEIYRVHDTIVEKLVDGQNLLINKNIDLIEYSQKLMDLIIRHGIPPEPREDGSGGPKKSPGE